LKSRLSRIFQISAVFIGTIVGAGLASGAEITEFFTNFGYKSFLGIVICGIFYIPVSTMFIKISIKHNLKSYNELITLVNPGLWGQLTDAIMTFFLVSGSAIILAGSGALLRQYFGVSRWVGILLMAALAAITLMRDTQGLIDINSFIVPSLIIVLTTLFLLYILLSRDTLSVSHIRNVPYTKNYWFASTVIYSAFNLLCASGVLVPLSTEIKNAKILIWGITFGALGLTVLSIFINLMLMLNVPYIHNYQIPLLYIANRFGAFLQIILLMIIWLEMFSTEVSDIYSVSKTLEHAFKIPFKKGIFIVLAIALPISQIEFRKLISILYPAFGVVSLIFIVQCSIFYYKNKVTILSINLKKIYNKKSA
jgi:uncharacterized membrane protein YkvI